MIIPKRTVDDFWARARQISYRGPVGGLLHRQIIATTNYIDPRNSSRVRVLGTASRQQVENLFYPSSYAPRERRNRNGRKSVRRGSGAGRSSIFHGRAMEQLIVVPFEREPGDIAAFAMLDAEEGHAEDGFAQGMDLPRCASSPIRDNIGNLVTEDQIIFKSVGPSQRRSAEAGLAMYSAAVLRNPARFANELFVFLDLAIGLQVQLKWMISSVDFLPIVVARDDDRFCTYAPWERLSSERKIVIVSQTAEPRVIRQARLAKARIYIDRDLTRKVRTTILPSAV